MSRIAQNLYAISNITDNNKKTRGNSFQFSFAFNH